MLLYLLFPILHTIVCFKQNYLQVVVTVTVKTWSFWIEVYSLMDLYPAQDVNVYIYRKLQNYVFTSRLINPLILGFAVSFMNIGNLKPQC